MVAPRGLYTHPLSPQAVHAPLVPFNVLVLSLVMLLEHQQQP